MRLQEKLLHREQDLDLKLKRVNSQNTYLLRHRLEEVPTVPGARLSQIDCTIALNRVKKISLERYLYLSILLTKVLRSSICR